MADTTIGTSVAIATPDLEIIEGQITTTSTQVAAHFNKRHADVLRAIRNLTSEVDADFYQRNFASVMVEFTNGKGGTQQAPAYRITRDGFTLLAMGFTGKEAMQWKVAYLTAFNKMEQELLSKRTSLPYTAQPRDKLTLDQGDELRSMLETAAQKLPPEKRGTFLQSGWAKLKKHTGVNYRQIPQAAHTDALSLLARHVAEWELVDLAPAPAPRPALPPGKMMVDRQKLAAVWSDLGKLRNRIDGLGILESDLPPSWWRQQQISA